MSCRRVERGEETHLAFASEMGVGMGKRTTPPRVCGQDGVVVLLVHRNWEVVMWGRDQPHLTIVSKMGVGKRSTPSRVCERDEVVGMWGREQPHLAFARWGCGAAGSSQRDQPHFAIASELGVGKRSTPSRVCK